MTMKAIEIQEHARRLYQAHGAKAHVEVASKAKAFEEAGNQEQARDWRRIGEALSELQGPHVS